MKKLKTLCAIVGATAVLYGSAAFAGQQFKVPEYDLNGAEEITVYQAITPSGEFPINDPSEAGEFPLMTIKLYGVDRNKDGRKDLIHSEIDIADIKFKGDDGKEIFLQKGYKVKQLLIDDDFDDYIDRMLQDLYDKDGNPGCDGIYENEYEVKQDAPKVEDILEDILPDK